MEEIILKRIYEPFEQLDGYRILVDRLWPRGISKEEAQLTLWAKDVAPSNELRKWFGHKSERFDDFRIKYLEELRNDSSKSNQVQQLCNLAAKHKLTLLFAAKDPIYNNAYVLKEVLTRKIANHSADLFNI